MNDIPAFPLHNHGTQSLGMHFSGMTLRDYFAAKSMQSLLARSEFKGSAIDYASIAYEQADAMMEARK
jgi:hypothetical protein